MQGTPEDIKVVTELRVALENAIEWMKTSEFFRKRVKVDDLVHMLSMVLANDDNQHPQTAAALDKMAELRVASEPLFLSLVMSIMCAEMDQMLNDLSKDDRWK